MQKYDLDGIKMNAVETDENGVIGRETIFTFAQKDNFVKADYSGGKIIQGYLVGILTEESFTFRYCQLEEGGCLNGGISNCTVRTSESSLLQIIEEFQWESREGGGKNVLQEIKQ